MNKNDVVYGNVIYEIPKKIIRHYRFFPIFAGTILALYATIPFVYLRVRDGIEHGFWNHDIIIIPFIMVMCVYITYWISFSINSKFGIYEKGIYPLRKSIYFKPCWPKTIFIPYKDIQNIELKGKQKKRFLAKPFEYIITRKDNKKFYIHGEELLRIVGDTNEIRRIYDVMSEVMKQWKGMVTKNETGEPEPFVLNKIKVNKIITNEYCLTPPLKGSLYTGWKIMNGGLWLIVLGAGLLLLPINYQLLNIGILSFVGLGLVVFFGGLGWILYLNHKQSKGNINKIGK